MRYTAYNFDEGYKHPRRRTAAPAWSNEMPAELLPQVYFTQAVASWKCFQNVSRSPLSLSDTHSDLCSWIWPPTEEATTSGDRQTPDEKYCSKNFQTSSPTTFSPSRSGTLNSNPWMTLSTHWWATSAKSSTDRVLGSPVHRAASSFNHVRLSEERGAACRRRDMARALPVVWLVSDSGLGVLFFL